MTAPTVRHRQQINAAVLANLLTHDLPLPYWTIFNTDGRAEGLVGSADEVRAWAQVISGGVVSTERYRNGSARFRASGSEPYAHIEIWYPLTAEKLAELDREPAEPATVEGVVS